LPSDEEIDRYIKDAWKSITSFVSETVQTIKELVRTVFNALHMAIIGLIFIGPTFAYCSGAYTGAQTLSAASIAFVVYTVYLLIEAFATTPAPRIFEIPPFPMPDTIDRESAAQMYYSHIGKKEGEKEAAKIVTNLLTQIRKAADAPSIHSLVEAQFNTLRYENDQRFATAEQRISSLAFVGFMGTVVGLMAFLAQADAVLDLFGAGNSQAMLSELDLTGVASAFLTTFIGLMGKAWIAKGMARDQIIQDESLIKFEKWLQNEVLVRLHLPSQVTTYLTLKATSDLAQPLVQAMGGMQAIIGDFGDMVDEMKRASHDQLTATKMITAVIGPKLKQLAADLDKIDGMVIESHNIEGGTRFTVVGRKTEVN